MEQKTLTEYVCQYWHDFYYNDDDGCWVTEKTVSTEEEAEAWINGAPNGERTYFPVKTSTASIMKEQLKCLQVLASGDYNHYESGENRQN